MNHRVYQTTLLAAVALIWTAAGETSDPLLAAAELPSDVALRCDARTDSAGCAAALTHHWLGRAAQGELFLVVHAGCRAECNAWLVQRSARGTRTLLALTGEFRLVRAIGPYPAVQMRTAVSTTRVNYTHYVWDGRGYAPAETRDVYRVDGVECGTVAECDAAARAALARGQNERAVRIYEQVRGVGFI